jgi:hypothetical protein
LKSASRSGRGGSLPEAGGAPDKRRNGSGSYARKLVVAASIIAGMSVLWVVAALAVQPNKGALYESNSDHEVSFEVSAGGKSITHFHGPTLFACGVIAPGPAQYPSRTKISHGKFTIKEILPPHSKNSAILSGHFTAHGGVTGKVKVATQCLRPPNFNSGPVKHKTFTWSSTSEPAGKTSRWCPDTSKRVPHFGPFNFTSLIEKSTSCETVAKAIKAGKVTPQTSVPPLFSTPGWTCTRSMTTGRYLCKRRKASFSWLNGI